MKLQIPEKLRIAFKLVLVMGLILVLTLYSASEVDFVYTGF